MSDAMGAGRQFGEGPLSRVTATVYTLLVVEVLFLATVVPGLAALVLLDHDASNLPLAAVCLVPVGPAVSAALYALYHRRGDLTDLKPAAAYLRGLGVNLRNALQVWVAWLLWLTIVAVNLTHLHAAGLSGWWRVPLVLVGAAVTLVGANALVITSLFAFRARDVARLAVYFLVRSPGTVLGNAGLLVIATAVAVLLSEVLVVLLASVFVLALLSTCRPMITTIAREFTA